MISITILKEEQEAYGIDWDGPSPTNDAESVEVPETVLPSGHSIAATVDPFAHTDNYGIDLYFSLLNSIIIE